MANKKSNSLVKEEYRKARRRLKENVRSLEKRGYDVSKINIPAIPDDIRKKHINELNKINKERYKKAFVIRETQTVNKRTGEVKVKAEKISGTRFRNIERLKAGKKASKTRKVNEIEKRYNKAIQGVNPIIKETAQWRIQSLKEDEIRNVESNIKYDKKSYDALVESEVQMVEERYYYESTQEWERKSEIDYTAQDYYERAIAEGDTNTSLLENMQYYYDAETGEFIEAYKLSEKAKKSPRMVLLSKDKTAEKLFSEAMADLDVMISYSGTPKDSKQKLSAVAENAKEIKQFLINEFNKNPDKVAMLLRNMQSKDGFHTVDYMYRRGGYGAFLHYYQTAISSAYDIYDREIAESNATSDYDDEYEEYDE